jgi:hypothetical protein
MGRLSRAMGQPLAYNEAAKNEFKLAARQALKKLAVTAGLSAGSYDLRWNAGGIACSGEATLHTNNFYVQVFESGMGFNVLYRTCRGRQDYTGGPNHWAHAVELEDTALFVRFLYRILGSDSAPAADLGSQDPLEDEHA